MVRFYAVRGDESRIPASNQQTVLLAVGGGSLCPAADRYLEAGQERGVGNATLIGVKVAALHRDAAFPAADPQTAPLVRQRREDLAEAEAASPFLGASRSGP